MNAANDMKKTFLLRILSLAMLGALFASGCRSATDSNAAGLPIVFFEGGLTGQLVLMSEDGTVRRQLLDLPDGFAKYLRWSPSGQQIVFTLLSPNPRGPIGLFIVNVDGSGLRQISPPHLGSEGGGMVGADWSPDGTRLAVYSGETIAVIGQDGSGFTSLPATNVYLQHGGWGISWAPDGNEILYNGAHAVAGGLGVGGGLAPAVWVFNIPTGASRMLATHGVDARWSPDGRRIAYIATSSPGDPGGLTVINSDGSNPRTLVPAGSAGPTLPAFSWSPDDQWLLYSGERAPCGCTALYTIAVDGGQSIDITNAPGKFARYPDWHRAR